MIWDERDAINIARGTPATGLPSSFADNYQAARAGFIRENQSDSAFTLYSEAYDDYIQRFEKLTGKRLRSPTEFGGIGPSLTNNGEVLRSVEKQAAEVAKMRETFPDLASAIEPFPTLETIRTAAIPRARAQRATEADIASRATTGGDFGSLAGMAVGGITDPVNLVTLPFGAASGTRVLAAAAIEAGIVLGTESLVVQPNTYRFKQSIDSPYTFSEAVGNAVLAAAGTAVLAGGIRAAPMTARKFLDWSRKNRPDRPPTQAERNADALLEREAEVGDSSPNAPTIEGDMAHLDTFQRAMDDVAEGRPLAEAPPAPRGDLPSAPPPGISRVRASDLLTGGEARGAAIPDDFDPARAGVLLVYEREDGGLVVMDGRKRAEAAQRANPGQQIDAVVVREADGYTADEVQARALFKNALEGRLSPEERAAVEALVQERGLPPADAVAPASGPAIAPIDETLTRARDRVLDEAEAAIRERHADWPGDPDDLIRALREATDTEGSLTDALNNAARALASGDQRAVTATRDFLGAFRRAVDAGTFARPDRRGGGPVPPDTGGPQRLRAEGIARAQADQTARLTDDADFEAAEMAEVKRILASTPDLAVPIRQEVDPETGSTRAETLSAEAILKDADDTARLAETVKGCAT